MEKIVHHIRHKSLKKYSRRSGFTAIISNEHPFGKDYVHVRYSFCSNKDQFSRKKGREMAKLSPAKELHIKELPKFLQELEGLCFDKHYNSDERWIDVDGRYYRIALAFALDRE